MGSLPSPVAHKGFEVFISFVQRLEMICELCGRDVSAVVPHHLIPRCTHRNKRIRRMFSRDEMRTRIARVCPSCSNFIHKKIREKEMALSYNTVEALKLHPEIAVFLEWISKRPGETVFK